MVLQAIVKMPNSGKELLRSSLNIAQNLDALTAVLRGMLSIDLKSFLVDFITLSISEWKLVKIPNFGEELLRCLYFVRYIAFQLKLFSVDFLTLNISE